MFPNVNQPPSYLSFCSFVCSLLTFSCLYRMRTTSKRNMKDNTKTLVLPKDTMVDFEFTMVSFAPDKLVSYLSLQQDRPAGANNTLHWTHS